MLGIGSSCLIAFRYLVKRASISVEAGHPDLQVGRSALLTRRYTSDAAIRYQQRSIVIAQALLL